MLNKFADQTGLTWTGAGRLGWRRHRATLSSRSSPRALGLVGNYAASLCSCAAGPPAPPAPADKRSGVHQLRRPLPPPRRGLKRFTGTRRPLHSQLGRGRERVDGEDGPRAKASRPVAVHHVEPAPPSGRSPEVHLPGRRAVRAMRLRPRRSRPVPPASVVRGRGPRRSPTGPLPRALTPFGARRTPAASGLQGTAATSWHKAVVSGLVDDKRPSDQVPSPPGAEERVPLFPAINVNNCFY
eukprot:14194307-Heterocapsa_arctica.AAC.1